MWLDESLVELGWCAESGDGDGVLMNGNLVKRRDVVEQGEDEAFSKRVNNNIVDPWGGELSKAAGIVGFLVVDRHADAAIFLGNDTSGL